MRSYGPPELTPKLWPRTNLRNVRVFCAQDEYALRNRGRRNGRQIEMFNVEDPLSSFEQQRKKVGETRDLYVMNEPAWSDATRRL